MADDKTASFLRPSLSGLPIRLDRRAATALAVVVVVAALALRILLGDILPGAAGFILFSPAILLAAVAGGSRLGLAALALSLAAALLLGDLRLGLDAAGVEFLLFSAA